MVYSSVGNTVEKSDSADLARLEEEVAKLEEGSQRVAVTK